ncbi:hypothetical protein [Rhodococcus erythropolis]|uniref:hypothetical protein n=1 Tax=Rhodococcus erythropolis TaxID=1833 RepID=UPI0003138D80|nr:hypothetical protein [Rhodococcus erythropolis]
MYAIRNARNGEVCSTCGALLRGPDHYDSGGVVLECSTAAPETKLEAFCFPCAPIGIDGELPN